jgi:hypothetical protein
MHSRSLIQSSNGYRSSVHNDGHTLDLTINGQQASKRWCLEDAFTGETLAMPQIKAAEVVRQARFGGRIQCSFIACLMLVHACPCLPNMCGDGRTMAFVGDNVFLLNCPENLRELGDGGRSFGPAPICH